MKNWHCAHKGRMEKAREKKKIEHGICIVYLLHFCPQTLQHTPFLNSTGIAGNEDILRVQKGNKTSLSPGPAPIITALLRTGVKDHAL